MMRGTVVVGCSDMVSLQGGRKMKYVMSLSVAIVSVMASATFAQTPVGEEKEVVIAHRLQEWQTKHFDDPAKAQQHADALKKLGAEVRFDQHSGHTDVAYRSVGWKPFRVGSDELAHQWEDWLKASGFETIHGHSPDHEKHAHHEGHDHDSEHHEVILFRSIRQQSQHFNDAAAANEFVTIVQALGCDADKSEHAGHTDVRFVCPTWMAVEFPDHKTAEGWMKWLKSAGFEVQHDDDHEQGHDH
jgi:hypothetical protein